MHSLPSDSTLPATRVTPVILSGGSGTRLWPVSRKHFPKQFTKLLGDETLFTATLRRVNDRSRYLPPIIVGNKEHQFFIREALDALGIKDATVLLEPVGRNTAAAALVAALHAEHPTQDSLHLVLPSDHMITRTDAFHQAVAIATEAARQEYIVLFGIEPSAPETGFGYIAPGASVVAAPEVKAIRHFHEKPDPIHAASLMREGALWNSGMFLYNPALLLNEAEALDAAHLSLCREALNESTPSHHALLLDESAYTAMKNHAFDTLIMERTEKGAVLPCQMGWSDVGSWHALWEVSDKDVHGNAVSGPAILHETQNSYVHTQGNLVTMIGMEDCMVISTKDAVLVAPKSRSQEVKALLTQVESRHLELTQAHSCVPRPWGSYENIAQGPHFLVKHIAVKPGRSLSLQMHHHRAEHWIVVAGTARVECDGVEKFIFPNQSIFIPQGGKHRLSNPGKIDLQLIEVQSGDYIGEDDIVRFEDMYGRVAEKQKT